MLHKYSWLVRTIAVSQFARFVRCKDVFSGTSQGPVVEPVVVQRDVKVVQSLRVDLLQEDDGELAGLNDLGNLQTASLKMKRATGFQNENEIEKYDGGDETRLNLNSI